MIILKTNPHHVEKKGKMVEGWKQGWLEKKQKISNNVQYHMPDLCLIHSYYFDFLKSALSVCVFQSYFPELVLETHPQNQFLVQDLQSFIWSPNLIIPIHYFLRLGLFWGYVFCLKNCDRTSKIFEIMTTVGSGREKIGLLH